MLENYHFATTISVDSGRDNQWLKPLGIKAYQRIGYSHNLGVFPHWLPVNYKGKL